MNNRLLFTVICIVAAIVSFTILVSCKKNHLKNEEPQAEDENIVKTEWEIMSNPTDPMFAIAKTDTSQIEFYGDRDASGIPLNLHQFVVKNRKDTIYYHLDDNSRPLVIQSTTGFEYTYVWKNANEADLTVTSKNGENTLKTSIKLDAKTNSTGSVSGRGPISAIRVAANTNPLSVQTTGTDNPNSNINVNITKCGKTEAAYLGDVRIELRTVQGNQDKTYLPVSFINGKYVASLPVEVPGNLIPSPVICDKILYAISQACKLPQPGGSAIIAASCVAIDLALASSGVGIPAAAAFAGYCTTLVANYKIYCAVNAAVSASKLCEAKYIKRIYNQGVYLQPIIYYNGKMIKGELSSTIGGGQQIALSLNIDECDGAALLLGSRYSLISWRYGAAVPGMLNFQSPTNPPYYTFEPGQEYYFDKEATFSVTSIGIPPAPNTISSGHPYRIGTYSPDSLFLGLQGSGPTNSYGHQFAEGWGTKLPPGYNLYIFYDYYPSRLSKDGQYLYRGDYGDMIFRKK